MDQDVQALSSTLSILRGRSELSVSYRIMSWRCPQIRVAGGSCVLLNAPFSVDLGKTISHG
jgi:hypothetical protein